MGDGHGDCLREVECTGMKGMRTRSDDGRLVREKAIFLSFPLISSHLSRGQVVKWDRNERDLGVKLVVLRVI